MLKFVEIVGKTQKYDPKLETCITSSHLEEIYINPDFIISMKVNASLKQEFLIKPFIEGLNKDVCFTELTIRAPGQTTQKINVIDDPANIIERIDNLT